MHHAATDMQMTQMLLAIILGVMTIQSEMAIDKEDHFERHIRPLVVERCHKGLSGNEAKEAFALIHVRPC